MASSSSSDKSTEQDKEARQGSVEQDKQVSQSKTRKCSAPAAVQTDATKNDDKGNWLVMAVPCNPYPQCPTHFLLRIVGTRALKCQTVSLHTAFRVSRRQEINLWVLALLQGLRFLEFRAKGRLRRGDNVSAEDLLYKAIYLLEVVEC